jgi:hypothetical protein
LFSHLLSKNLKIKTYKTIILPFVLYGGKTWSLTLREENRWTVYKNRVLWRMFGPNWEEVVEGWSIMDKVGRHNLYTSPNISRVIKSRRIRWAGHVALMGAMRNIYSILVGKLEGESPFGRPRRRWEDNITMDLKETGWECVDWIHLVLDKDQWRALVNLRFQ